MSLIFISESVFASLPRTTRGTPIVLGGDPKGKNFLYTNNNSVIIRDISVSFFYVRRVFIDCACFTTISTIFQLFHPIPIWCRRKPEKPCFICKHKVLFMLGEYSLCKPTCPKPGTCTSKTGFEQVR